METPASERKRWLGIDFSGNYRMWGAGCRNSNVWIADVGQDGQFVLHNLRTVQELPGDGAPFHKLRDHLKNRDFDAAGIDAPLSVPVGYMPSGGHHRLLEIVSKTQRLENPWFPSANEFRGSVLAGRTLSKKPFRETEKYWIRPNLNPRSTLWDRARSGAPMTSACLTLLQEAECPIWPWHRPGSAGLLVEAFPAAQLCYWGDLPYYGYSGNGTKALNNRQRIVEFLSEYVALDKADKAMLRRMEDSADALDAVICAFAAIAVTTGCVFELPGQTPKEEGLIAVHAKLECSHKRNDSTGQSPNHAIAQSPDHPMAQSPNHPITQWPDGRGRFGEFGGRYVPETLMHPVEELEQAFEAARRDSNFQAELDRLLRDFAGRPTPLFHARRLSGRLGGAQIYLKREDLLHTGAHKLNNCLGQGLLAKRMGKTRLVAETGAGQHGVATATVAALLGMQCVVYMGEEDMARQAPNVFRMQLLGTEVVGVASGSRTLKDAINEAMRDWVTNVENTHYLLGSVLGPHPYPVMVREFHRVIGQETRRQILEATGKLPDWLFACVGGGSNSIGLFYDFIPDREVKMVGVEAGGRSLRLGEHAARFAGGKPGVLHGTYTYVLQTEDGLIASTHSVSAGLDYPAVGPEHAALYRRGRVEYTQVSDQEALEAAGVLAHEEGIIPALEPAHALAEVLKRAPAMPAGAVVVVNLSGRGDKDLGIFQSTGIL